VPSDPTSPLFWGSLGALLGRDRGQASRGRDDLTRPRDRRATCPGRTSQHSGDAALLPPARRAARRSLALDDRYEERLALADVARGADRTVESERPLQLSIGFVATPFADEPNGESQTHGSLIRRRCQHDKAICGLLELPLHDRGVGLQPGICRSRARLLDEHVA